MIVTRLADRPSPSAGRPLPGPRTGRALTLAGVVSAAAATALVLGACAPAPTSAAPADATVATTTAGATTVTTPPTGTAPSATATTPAALPPAAPTPPIAAATPTAAAAAFLTTGATGDRVRELQARLTQLDWYSGTTTGSYDVPTSAGVRGFQDRRGLPATGATDVKTWSVLVGMTRTPTGDEIHNVLRPGPALLRQGATGAAVRDLQARLKQIGWWSGAVTDTYGPQSADAVRQFQTKRGIPVTGEVDQRTTDRLLGMTRTPTSDELTNTVPKPPTGTAAGLDPRCLTGRVVCISTSARSLTWVVDGQARMRLDVRFGSENNPTREGAFTVYRKNREWTSTIYGSSMPFSMFFSGGEAVHYSSDFAARGYAGASHGCVNVRDYNGLATLFDLVAIGDRVIVS